MAMDISDQPSQPKALPKPLMVVASEVVMEEVGVAIILIDRTK